MSKKFFILTLVLLTFIIIVLLVVIFCHLKIVFPSTARNKFIISDETIVKQAGAGDIGEKITEQEAKERGNLPPMVFYTRGRISEIRTNGLLVAGDGSNFNDQQPRNLTVIFAESTIVYDSANKVRYLGFEGLKHLKPNTDISIQAEDNIRGKIEFYVKIINY